MTQVHPFSCYVAQPGRASEIACPAYDAMTPAQRHQFASAHPDNYLNVMRSTNEFPEQERPSFDVNLQRNSSKLRELLSNGSYLKHDRPGFYIYQLETGRTEAGEQKANSHSQTGIVAELPVGEFQHGGVKKHEHTRRDKEDALILYRDKMRVSSTPVTLSYTDTPVIQTVVDQVTSNAPLIDFACINDGLQQRLWFVDAPELIEKVQSGFAGLPAVYLTDGHHRSAVCERWAEQCREQNPEHRGDEAYNFVLSALFPDQQNRILEYNRYVTDLNGLTQGQFMAQLNQVFDIELLIGTETNQPVKPTTPHQFSMYINGQWCQLQARGELVCSEDPVQALDVQYLQTRVLDPILGITDPRADDRLDYVPGAFGLDELESRVNWGGGVAFACYPTSIAELKAVADAGKVMPPKSTWFDPKVRSGLLVRLR